ncbi:MAG: DUF6691 family protein [Microcystaceae cyanobacterium]
MKQKLIALLSGLLFGVGLSLSQMIDRNRVLGFLDIAGNWDPTLIFVLGGAVGVTVILFRFVLRLPQPIFADKFYLPTKKDIDLPLILGAAIFGIGWGIGGYCPGPAITALILKSLNPILFIGSFILGSLVYQGYSGNVERKKQKQETTF